MKRSGHCALRCVAYSQIRRRAKSRRYDESNPEDQEQVMLTLVEAALLTAFTMTVAFTVGYCAGHYRKVERTHPKIEAWTY